MDDCEMMAMPYFAAFYITRALLPAMLRRGSGHLVYVNSPASLVAWPGAAAYTAARWALRGFAEALRADLRGTRLRVSSVIPGKVSSSYFAHNRRGPWADGGPFIYKDATLVPNVCGQAGCWSDRIRLDVELLAERAAADAQPPRLEA